MNDNPKQDSSPGANPEPFDPESEAALLSAYMDGELDAEQVARIEAHLAESPESRAEVARMRRLKEVTDAMSLRDAPAEDWERFWCNIYNKVERGIGWFALTLGAVIVAGYGLYHFILSLLESSEITVSTYWPDSRVGMWRNSSHRARTPKFTRYRCCSWLMRIIPSKRSSWRT